MDQEEIFTGLRQLDECDPDLVHDDVLAILEVAPVNRRVIEAAGGLLDMVYTYDDVGIQSGLLLSPRMWRKYILPRQKLGLMFMRLESEMTY